MYKLKSTFSRFFFHSWSSGAWHAEVFLGSRKHICVHARGYKVNAICNLNVAYLFSLVGTNWVFQILREMVAAISSNKELPLPRHLLMLEFGGPEKFLVSMNSVFA